MCAPAKGTLFQLLVTREFLSGLCPEHVPTVVAEPCHAALRELPARPSQAGERRSGVCTASAKKECHSLQSNSGHS